MLHAGRCMSYIIYSTFDIYTLRLVLLCNYELLHQVCSLGYACILIIAQLELKFVLSFPIGVRIICIRDSQKDASKTYTKIKSQRSTHQSRDRSYFSTHPQSGHYGYRRTSSSRKQHNKDRALSLCQLRKYL